MEKMVKFFLFFTFLNFVTCSKYTPSKLPSIPLAVRSPYFNTWITHPDKLLYGAWPTFWNGDITGLTGIIKVDGEAFEFIGHPTQDPIGTNKHVTQEEVHYTATQTIFTLSTPKITLKLNFLSPVEPNDLKRQSIPASYILGTVTSKDGKPHKVQVYVDTTAEWVSGKPDNQARWFTNKNIALKHDNTLLCHDVYLDLPQEFQEWRDHAEWGTFKLFTKLDGRVTYQSGVGAVDTRKKFVSAGKLDNKFEQSFRHINANWPVFAFTIDLGTVTPSHHGNFEIGMAFVRTPIVQYTEGHLKPYWQTQFSDEDEMISFFYDDVTTALERANNFDKQLTADAKKVGGDDYVTIVNAATRQAYAGVELAKFRDDTWYMMKEISSDGNCNTADVIYPHFSLQYYFNPKMIKYLLDPLFHEQEAGYYPHKFAMHDLGTHYPRCIGHPDGKDEIMEIEESANMIVITASYLQASKDLEFVERHYKILKQWADYLVEKDRALFPGEALTTDDFMGRIKNTTNLAIKGIVAVRAMAGLAKEVGNEKDFKHYQQKAAHYMKEWEKYALDSSKKHYKFGYGLDGSWSMLYNVYTDRLLNQSLVPDAVIAKQEAWYKQVAGKYGIAVISGQPNKPNTWAKTDWEGLTAGATNDKQLQQMIFKKLVLWLNETKSLRPFSDWYDTKTGDSPGFVNRPAIGAVFAPLARARSQGLI